MYYLDTETCGLHGIIVLIQYAKDDGEIILHNVWKKKISETLELLKELANNVIIGFNLAFDWFHLNKLFTVFSLVLEEYGDIIPEDYIEEISVLEGRARFYPYCVKPKAALDLMLYARKEPYQS